ncbi:response regulator [Paenibacillus qinlingensis]|uniref:Two-component system response regulator YesN n=1 Tax=Paenibacillus qinlingensis TaxID=1837343 RepID=A0ABU1NUI8_9BACL|nr:response regulator [Paenibacillus qinlingensis]MDR6551090.1 two-component system response regulator YesN [Paenibacillus qinlingensis]
MYKLLIVEDEHLIRAGLHHYFNWSELGVTTIVEADNGREGMLTALREEPDLIITDIRMPEMDGLQMIEHIRAALPDTLFIILTGFNDFDYAQKAIRLGGVHAFLLKPMEYEESLSTIQSCMATLKQRRNDKILRTELEQQARETTSFKNNQLVKFLLEDEHAAWEEGISLQLRDFGSMAFTYQPFVLTWLPIATTPTYERKAFRQKAEHSIQTALETMYGTSIPMHLFVYIDRAKCYAIAVMEDHKNMQEIMNASLSTTDSSLFMAIGRSTTDSSQLTQRLRLTDQALYQRYFQTNRQVLFPIEVSEVPARAKDVRLLLDEGVKNRVISGLETGNTTDIEQLMHQFAQDLITHLPHTSTDRGFAFIQEIIAITLRFAHRNGIPVEGVYSEKLLKLTCVDDFRTLEALFSWLAAWMVQVSEVYRNESTLANHPDVLIFEHIEAYIKEHIDQDITLQMVADRFFYNPSYLSRIFKRKLDKNYMRFVTEIRIQYAQECLKKPEYLVTDVCTMCGYKSYKHFVKTFRSITHMTPTDYRKKWGW